MAEFNVQQKKTIDAYRNANHLGFVFSDSAIAEMILKEMQSTGKVYEGFESLAGSVAQKRTAKETNNQTANATPNVSIWGNTFVEETAVSQTATNQALRKPTKQEQVALDFLGRIVNEGQEIFDARVFLKATEKVFNKCNELAIADGMMEGDGLYTLMSYNHLAGELALHMILADVTNDLGATKGNGILRDLYNKAVVSDLNVDEDRIAPAIIEFFGQSVVFFLNTFFVTFKK